MEFRKFRIRWSAFWGVVCILLIALWIRSYWVADFIQPWRSHLIVSLRGSLFFDKKIILTSSSKDVPAGLAQTKRFFAYSLATNQFKYVPVGSGLALPYWMIAALTLGLAPAPWFGVHFRLRTFLIVIALVAALMGFVIYANR